MFFENCEELHDIDLTSSFYRPEASKLDTPIKNTYDEDILEYYNYETNLLDTDLGFGGSYDSLNDEQFVSSAVKMYNDDDFWRDSLTKGLKILQKRHDILTNERVLMGEISNHEML